MRGGAGEHRVPRAWLPDAVSAATRDGSPADLGLAGLALAFAAFLLATSWIPPWGLFHDELYYWVCARRLELGYVDHPPLAPWVLRATTALLGEGPLAFRIPPALCGAGTLLLAGAMARRMGAGGFGRLVAALCVAVAPVMLGFFGFYSVNALEIVCWALAGLLLMERIRTGDERWWLALGALAGIALLNKHTFLLLAFGLAAGVLASPLRADLRSRWPWLGAALALLLVLPNVVWNAQHGWPSLAFYRSRAAMNLPTSPADALLVQTLLLNPVTSLVWVPGLCALLFSRAARRWRPLGIAFLSLFVVMLLSGERRGDRIAGAYPVVFAAGGAFWDRWRGPGRRFVRVALPALIVLFGLAMLPASLPVVPPRAVADYFAAIGEKPEMEAADRGHDIPVHLLGRLEWERFAADVIAAWETLPPGDRERAVVLAPHWLYASVVEYYGRDRGLPPVVSPHNAYFFWRDDAAERDVVLAVAISPDVLARHFEKTRVVGVFRCEYCASWRPDLPVVLATGPSRPLEELLTTWRHFGLEPAPRLKP